MRKKATDAYDSLPVATARNASDVGNVLRTTAAGGALGLAAGGIGIGAYKLLRNRGRL